MRKLFLIALKDLRLIFRDRAALVMMLLAPFLLTLGLGAVTGRFSGSDNMGFNIIPVAIVNQDEGALGKTLIDLFQSDELKELVATSLLDEPSSAFSQVDADQFAAAIIIPKGFTASIIPKDSETSTVEDQKIVFYANPVQPMNAGILRTILDQFISQVEVGRIATEVTITQLLKGGYITPDQAGSIGEQVGAQQAVAVASSPSIKLKNITASGGAVEFDILGYMAPGMALMFLMFTVTYGGRSLMVEDREGTLSRMLISPTTTSHILGGKVFGIFLTAVAQLLILVVSTSLLFKLQWGDPLAVFLLVLAAAAGATGWGMLIAAFFKTPGQIASVGSAAMLIFGILGGSFFDISMLPGWLNTLSKITPNAWGISGFSTLAMGGTLRNITTPLIALVAMGVILFIIAALQISRRGLGRR